MTNWPASWGGKHQVEDYKKTVVATLTPLTVSRAQTIILMYSPEELVSPAGEQPLTKNIKLFMILFTNRLTD